MTESITITVSPTSGVSQIFTERMRQIHKEGFDADHDLEHRLGQLTEAALCYGHVASAEMRGSCAEEWSYDMVSTATLYGGMLCSWPWTEKDWKPSDDPIRNLVKAGALIAAEIDRIQRLKPKE